LPVVLLWSVAALSAVLRGGLTHRQPRYTLSGDCRRGLHHKPYRERYKFIPLSQMIAEFAARCNLRGGRAILRAPWFDGRDPNRREDDMEGGRTRGASTITQQLVKKSVLRNEPIPLSERARRPRWYRWRNSRWASSAFWNYYLNVVEWVLAFMARMRRAGYHYGGSARSIGREERHGLPRFCRLR